MSHGFKGFDRKPLFKILEVGVQKLHVSIKPPFCSNPRVVNQGQITSEIDLKHSYTPQNDPKIETAKLKIWI